MSRLAPTLLRASRAALPRPTSRYTLRAYATAANATPAWMQQDKLAEKLKAIELEHNTRESRLSHAEGILPYYIMFPNEANPLKPSQEAANELAAQALPFDAAVESAVPVPKWREGLAQFRKEQAQEKVAVATSHHEESEPDEQALEKMDKELEELIPKWEQEAKA